MTPNPSAGDIIQFGGAKALIESVEYKFSDRREFYTPTGERYGQIISPDRIVTITMRVPAGVDIRQIFNAPAVTQAIEAETERLRHITPRDA